MGKGKVLLFTPLTVTYTGIAGPEGAVLSSWN
jgi:hypothetical protein